MKNQEYKPSATEVKCYDKKGNWIGYVDLNDNTDYNLNEEDLKNTETIYLEDYGSIENLAEQAYNAYCETTGWKSLYTGANLPPFMELKQETKNAWSASAKKLKEIIEKSKICFH